MNPELMTDRLWFPEGPVALQDGSVIVVEIKRGTLTRVYPDGAVQIVAELGDGPNGAAIGPDGAVYVCNNGGAWKWLDDEKIHLPDGPPLKPYRTGYIQRVDLATGAVSTLYDACDGLPLNSPNDLVFDSQGGMWFTCLGYSDGETRRYGALYYALHDGSRITRVRSELISPNGVGLSPDEQVVYMADCMVGRLYAFDLTAPGRMVPQDPSTTAPGRVVCTLPGYQWLDSLAVQANGRICVGTLWNGGITVFDPDGAYEHVPFPDVCTTNICFGGADMRDAFVTCSTTGCLYKCRWPEPGLKLPFNA